MTPGDSRRTTTIPPVRTTVKAGFVVYSHNDPERKIVILEKGGLRAVDSSVTPRKELFRMRPGDLVAVAPKAKELLVIKSALVSNERVSVPAWLEVDIEKLQGSVLSLPTREQIDLDINEQLIVELYSK